MWGILIIILIGLLVLLTLYIVYKFFINKLSYLFEGLYEYDDMALMITDSELIIDLNGALMPFTIVETDVSVNYVCDILVLQCTYLLNGTENGSEHYMTVQILKNRGIFLYITDMEDPIPLNNTTHLS